jgi:hypothetical protein
LTCRADRVGRTSNTATLTGTGCPFPVRDSPTLPSGSRDNDWDAHVQARGSGRTLARPFGSQHGDKRKMGAIRGFMRTLIRQPLQRVETLYFVLSASSLTAHRSRSTDACRLRLGAVDPTTAWLNRHMLGACHVRTPSTEPLSRLLPLAPTSAPPQWPHSTSPSNTRCEIIEQVRDGWPRQRRQASEMHEAEDD